jgi:hypothetical protein
LEKLNKVLNPAPSPISDILIKWDNMAKDRGLIDKRKLVWRIFDLTSGLTVDRGELVAELNKWNQTEEVIKVKSWVVNWTKK